MLDQAASIHPHSWWWVKADGVDVVPGLGESMRMEWSGDVDLNDGKLQQQYSSYIEQLDFIRKLSLGGDHSKLLEDLLSLHEHLGSDLKCINTCKLYTKL